MIFLNMIVFPYATNYKQCTISFNLFKPGTDITCEYVAALSAAHLCFKEHINRIFFWLITNDWIPRTRNFRTVNLVKDKSFV